jgi:hypothetical protein
MGIRVGERPVVSLEWVRGQGCAFDWRELRDRI